MPCVFPATVDMRVPMREPLVYSVRFDGISDCRYSRPALQLINDFTIGYATTIRNRLQMLTTVCLSLCRFWFKLPYAGYGPCTILDTRGSYGGTWYLRKLADDSLDFESGAVTLAPGKISPQYWNHIIVLFRLLLAFAMKNLTCVVFVTDSKRFSVANNNLHQRLRSRNGCTRVVRLSH